MTAFAQAGAADFVVSPQGDDDNPGTAQAPFATIAQAQQAVRKLRADGLDDDILVLIHDGIYRITEPLVFTSKDGGDKEHAVIYSAAKGEHPVISGGRPITDWQANKDGTWSAKLPEVAAGDWYFRGLFVRGHRRQRARRPNGGYFRVVQAGPDKRTSFTFKPGDIPALPDSTQAELVFLHDWSSSRVEIASVDPKAHVITLANRIGPPASHYEIDNYEPHPRYFLENARTFVDAPVEWFLDRQTGELTYNPGPHESVESLVAIAPAAQRLVVVRGTDQAPVRNLHFRGLIFRYCRWPLPEGGFAAGQATFHERRDDDKPGGGGGLREPVPAAILVEQARGVHWEHCRVEHLGTSGIRLGSRCRNCVIDHCVLADIAGNGVMIGEDRTRRLEKGPWWRAAPKQAARGNRLTNSVIDHCGRVFFGAVGVWIGLANHTTISKNVIRHLPYTGVSIGWMWNPTPTPCHHNLVTDNHIHHVMQVLSDGGGIYTLGRQPGTILRGNRIHAVPLNRGRAESNGMFLDEGTTDILIEKNLIYGIDRSPLRFHQAGENLVRNNVLAVPPETPPVRYNSTPSKNIHLKSNRIVPAKKFNPKAAIDPKATGPVGE